MSSSTNPPVSLPKPRLVGRLVRLVLGVLLVFFFVELVTAVSSPGSAFLLPQTGWNVPGGDWWIAAAICFFVLPVVINSGFGRRWGGWPRMVFLALAAGATLWDWLAYGSLWAPPLAVLILLLVAYVLAHAGISYLVAAVAATPG